MTRHAGAKKSERDSHVTIDSLNGEIARLNDELTCASEAHQAVVSENQRLKEALASAEGAFIKAGNSEMAERLRAQASGERPKPASFKLPSSRKVA